MEDQKLKKIMYVLAAVAVVLAGVLAYIWYDKYTVEKELESEKADLIGQLNTLNDDYASLSTDYEDVNLQLDSSRLEVQLLIEKLTKTEATNRAKIRQYERELGTLRTVMRGYVKQIDSLHSLNKQLTADAAEARREAAENRRRSEELSKTVEDLSGQVAAGAVIKARGLRAEAYNASNKVTDRSSRVKYLLATLNLVENDLAEKGFALFCERVCSPAARPGGPLALREAFSGPSLKWISFNFAACGRRNPARRSKTSPDRFRGSFFCKNVKYNRNDM